MTSDNVTPAPTAPIARPAIRLTTEELGELRALEGMRLLAEQHLAATSRHCVGRLIAMLRDRGIDATTSNWQPDFVAGVVVEVAAQTATTQPA